MNRRKFIKSSLLWIPSVQLFLPRYSKADTTVVVGQKIGGGGGGGTPAWVQDDGAQNDPFNSARSVTFGGSTVSGNCIVAVYRGSNSASLVVTDNKSNSYTRVLDGTTSGIAIAVAPNITGGASHQVTFTVTSHSNPGYMIIFEFSGIAASSPTDAVNESSGFVSNSSVSLTTTVNNTMLLGLLFSGAGGGTVGSGFTARHAQDTLQSETKVGASSGSNTVDWTHSERNAQIAAIALKPA